MAGYDDRDGKIWMDGQLVDWRAANVHVLSHAMHYASSVFEGERSYNGKIFLSRKHRSHMSSCRVEKRRRPLLSCVELRQIVRVFSRR